jgi:hypothetical protein
MNPNYQYEMLLVIDSSTMSLSELAVEVGVHPSPCSHGKGDPHPGKKKPPWDSTALKIESPLPITAKLQEHINAILSSLPERARNFLEAMPHGCSAYLDAGVIVNTHVVSFPHVQVPAVTLRALGKRGIDLVITMYPSGPGPAAIHEEP